MDIGELLCNAAKHRLVNKYMEAIAKMLLPSNAQFAMVICMDCEHNEQLFTLGNVPAERCKVLLQFGVDGASQRINGVIEPFDVEGVPVQPLPLDADDIGPLDPMRYRDA